MSIWGSYEILAYEIFYWLAYTKICTNENYPLYGITKASMHHMKPYLAGVEPPACVLVTDISLAVCIKLCLALFELYTSSCLLVLSSKPSVSMV